MGVTEQNQVLLMDNAQIKRTLERMTLELFEKHEPDTALTLVGIDSKGYWLAEEIANFWESATDDPVEVVRWYVKNDGSNSKTHKDLKGNTELILVDDVIFSGSTMMQALQEIAAMDDLESIMTVCLIDRGHRKWPVLANIVGKRIPTKLNEHVEVIFEEGGRVEKVQLKWLAEK